VLEIPAERQAIEMAVGEGKELRLGVELAAGSK
jgi:hypothetical protein